jgi:GNAT superfamily N-acetyltransferase
VSPVVSLGSGPVELAAADASPRFDVRLARVGEEGQICGVCREGFAASSDGLLSPESIEARAGLYYDPVRVRREIETAGETSRWQGYVVAVTDAGEVLGAAGGGMAEGVGEVYVLYLRMPLRGLGIGTALLDFVTEKHRAEGATEQWVSVTEGNDLGIPFYQARGFVFRERVPYVVRDDGTVEAHSVRMSRRI